MRSSGMRGFFPRYCRAEHSQARSIGSPRSAPATTRGLNSTNASFAANRIPRVRACGATCSADFARCVHQSQVKLKSKCPSRTRSAFCPSLFEEARTMETNRSNLTVMQFTCTFVTSKSFGLPKNLRCYARASRRGTDDRFVRIWRGNRRSSQRFSRCLISILRYARNRQMASRMASRIAGVTGRFPIS